MREIQAVVEAKSWRCKRSLAWPRTMCYSVTRSRREEGDLEATHNKGP